MCGDVHTKGWILGNFQKNYHGITEKSENLNEDFFLQPGVQPIPVTGFTDASGSLFYQLKIHMYEKEGMIPEKIFFNGIPNFYVQGSGSKYGSGFQFFPVVSKNS